MLDSNLTFRTNKELKDAFIKCANGNNRTASLLFNDFMREYVKKNSQGDMFLTGRKEKR